jgi:predicted MFS family arabinose efflux permease
MASAARRFRLPETAWIASEQVNNGRGASISVSLSRVCGGSARATILLSFGLVANLAAQMTFAATLHEIAADWALDASQSGWIGGVYFAGYAVAVPFLASATDRMDGRWLYMGSALLGAAASFAFAAFAHGFVVALILRFLGGIGLDRLSCAIAGLAGRP